MKRALLINFGLIIAVAVGTYLGFVVVPYAVIGVVCVVSILIARGLIKPKYYPIYIFGMALAMLWQTSMMGVFVVGADITYEHYASAMVMQNGLDWSLPNLYNASIVVTVIAPTLSKILHIELIWVYKVIFPVFLACVPLIMYFVFKKQFGEKRAYWASLFFMVVPVMAVEIVGNGKAMVAEVFFALSILTLFSNLKHLHRGIILTALVMVTLLCHYTMGIALLCFLIICLVAMSVARIWKVKGQVSLAVLAVAILLPCVAGYFYFSNISDGIVIKSLISISRTVTVNIPENVDVLSSDEPLWWEKMSRDERDKLVQEEQGVVPLEEDVVGEEVVGEDVTGKEVAEEEVVREGTGTEFYLNNQSPLVKAAIGLDFLQATNEGKIFRIVQYLTQILIPLGLIWLWRRRKQYSFTPEAMVCMLAGFMLLGMCVFIPYISRLINMTRYYHICLFFLAPLFVLGCELITRKKWLIPTVLLVYFVFTSGLVFEAMKSTAIERIDLPYSIPLSSERTGIVGVFNNNDMDCIEWLINSSDQELPIVNDVNTKRLLHGFMERYPRLFSEDYCRAYDAWSFDHLPLDDYYIFLSTWNVEHNNVILYLDTGTRKLLGLPADVYNLPIAYQSGKAVVLLKESE